MKVENLFSISFTHEYFSLGGSFVLPVPTAQTQQQLKRLGWVVRTAGNELVVAAETDATGRLRATPAPETMLRFWLKITDQHFVNYTDLPEGSQKKLMYFGNQNANASDPSKLHTGNAVSDTDFILPHTSVFDTPDEGTLVLRNTAGQTIAQATATPPRTTLALHHTDEGRHQPALNDNNLQPVCLGIPEMGLHAKGMIEISLAANAAQPCITPDDKPASAQYRIHFAARSVRWKYLLTGNGIDTYTQLAITDLRRTQYFTGPENATLINGSKALVFTSPDNIRFSDKPNGAFQLRRNCIPGGNAGSVVFDRLPRPAPDMLHGNSNQYYSEIIVHL
ncbi:MAG: hypothetical protein MUC87_17315 [Bacteroidia bacterium]|jgi:hypothetical protein|nr:hypothetical protein [Bacteroidia bacterium]